MCKAGQRDGFGLLDPQTRLPDLLQEDMLDKQTGWVAGTARQTLRRWQIIEDYTVEHRKVKFKLGKNTSMAFTHHNHESTWLRARSPWPYQWRLWEILLILSSVPVARPSIRVGNPPWISSPWISSRFCHWFKVFSRILIVFFLNEVKLGWQPLTLCAVNTPVNTSRSCANKPDQTRPLRKRNAAVSHERSEIPLINAHQPKPDLKRWVMLFADESMKQSGSVLQQWSTSHLLSREKIRKNLDEHHNRPH